MSKNIDKLKFSEVLANYELEPSLFDIYVEGNEDKEFYSYHTKCMGKNFNFIDISLIDFSEVEDSIFNGLERNNRDKILILIEKLKDKNLKVYGIIDRDFLEYYRGIDNIPKNVFLTDYSCIEAYYLCPQTINKISCLRYKDLKEETVKQVIKLAGSYTQFIMAEKFWNLKIKKIDYEKNYNPKSNSFDLESYILKCFNSKMDISYHSIIRLQKHLELNLEKINPKSYFNGHVAMDFLLFYAKEHYAEKNFKRKFEEINEFSSFLRVATETSFIENEPLFLILKKLF